ncbi:MAG: hypothetical protein IJB89_08325 [Akkermansia sp.]|nr:hypothetical protein [Akkermansia sp.]
MDTLSSEGFIDEDLDFISAGIGVGEFDGFAKGTGADVGEGGDGDGVHGRKVWLGLDENVWKRKGNGARKGEDSPGWLGVWD